jgi:hypothetical protein
MSGEDRFYSDSSSFLHTNRRSELSALALRYTKHYETTADAALLTCMGGGACLFRLFKDQLYSSDAMIPPGEPQVFHKGFTFSKLCSQLQRYYIDTLG